jgi:PKD repeat protein
VHARSSGSSDSSGGASSASGSSSASEASGGATAGPEPAGLHLRVVLSRTSPDGSADVALAAEGVDDADMHCTGDGTDVPMQTAIPLTHTYTDPGRYTVSFTAGVCPPLSAVTRTLEVVVS